MTDAPEQICVQADGPDIPAEVRECLGLGECRLTLGGYMRLVAARSPYIYGGQVADADLEFAARCLSVDPSCEDPHAEIVRALDLALGAFGMVVAPQRPERTVAAPDAAFGPEWLADLVSEAMHAAPGLTWREAMDEIPLLMVVHLALADYRRNGGRTERVNEDAEAKAVAELRRRAEERRRAAEAEGGAHG